MKERCPEIEGLLSAYHDGELAPDDARRVADHLGGCPDCSRTLETYATVDHVIASSVARRPEEEWDALAESVEVAVAAEERRDLPVGDRRPAGRRLGRPGPVLLGSAATALVALLIAVLQPELTRGPASPPARAPEAADEGPSAPPPIQRPEAEETGKRERRTPAVPGRPDASAAPGKRGSVREAPDPDGSGLRSPSAEVERVAPRGGLPAVDVSPLAPPGGAATIAEVRAAWARLGGGAEEPMASAPEDLLRDTDRGAKRRGTTEPTVFDSVWTWALRERDAGRTAEAREALSLLTGDLPGNDRREAAWGELLALEAHEVATLSDPERALRLARSFDAFRAAYPGRDAALEPRARAWVHAARLDPSRICAPARERVGEWIGAAGRAERASADALRDSLAAACGE